MKLKRFLCVIVVLALVFSFTACTKPATSDPTDENTAAPAKATAKPAEEAEETAKPSGEVETVTVWTKSGHTKDFFMKLVDEYNSTTGAEKGIKIEYKVNGGDHRKLLDMALANDQAPDLFRAVGPLTSFVSKNFIYAIDEVPGGEDFLKKYDGFLTKGAEIIGDHVYCVPYNQNTIGLIYNKDMFKDAGIVDANGEAMPPKTWDEIVEYSKKLTNPEKKQYGIVFPLKFGGCFNWFGTVPASASVGHGIFDPVAGQFDFNKFEPMIEKIMQIKEDNSFFPGAEGLNYDPARAQFAEGRVGMFFGVSWDVGVLVDQFPAKCDWGVAPVPVMDENEKYMQYSNTAPFLHINSNISDDRIDKVFEVFKWFHSDEVLVKLYEASKFFPYDPAILEQATNEPQIPQWNQFAELLPISKTYLMDPPIKLEGPNFKAMYTKVWAGAETLENATADLNKRYNEALKKGIEDGSIEPELYTDADWNLSR